MNRRASLPGIEELFGTSSGARDAGAAAQEGASGAGPQDPAVAESLALVRQLVAEESAAVRAAREAAQGLDLPSPEVGALLRWAATALQARAAVEIGSAGGLSGLWLVEGMAGGVLTSLEPDAQAHRLATDAFGQVAAGPRVRAIHGDVATLLERLADASYDLVVLQTDRGQYPEHLARARRLLRPGGWLIARAIVPVDEHQEPLTRFLHDLLEDPALNATVLPLDDGIALATRLPEED